jgi:hypothetical protein
MNPRNGLGIYDAMPAYKAVLKNAIPAIVVMLMQLIYNLADTFFIGLTRDDLQVAAVSIADCQREPARANLHSRIVHAACDTRSKRSNLGATGRGRAVACTRGSVAHHNVQAVGKSKIV